MGAARVIEFLEYEELNISYERHKYYTYDDQDTTYVSKFELDIVELT